MTARQDDLNRLVEAMTSERTGIIRHLNLESGESGESGLLEPLIAVADLGRLPGMQPIAQPGGSGFAVAEALARGVFETIERYCCAFVDSDRLLFSRARSGRFLREAVAGHFGDWQYAQPGWPFARFEADSSIHWVEGASLLSGEPVLVPAMCAYVPYRTENRMEWLGPSVSTGTAAGWCIEQACVGGLLEVLEREAFAVAWLHRLTRPRLRVAPGSPLGRALERYQTRTGAEVAFVDLTHDLGVPVVLAVLKRRDRLGRPILTVGSAAKPSPYEACGKAYSEALSGFDRVVSQMDAMPDWRPASNGANVVDWQWHGLAYGFEELHGAADFLTAAGLEHAVEVQPGPGSGPASGLETLLEKLSGTFKEIAVVDLTTREFRELGVHVVKVVVPEAVPLNPDHRYPWLGTRRLYEVPLAMGLPSVTSAADLNQSPHPFA